jgi:hypothetical protein
LPKDAAIIPFPNDELTPPVTKINLVIIFILCLCLRKSKVFSFKISADSNFFTKKSKLVQKAAGLLFYNEKTAAENRSAVEITY